MATTEEVIAFIREQANRKTYEQVQGEDESPADCGNYDDAYSMGMSSGIVGFAQDLVAWMVDALRNWKTGSRATMVRMTTKTAKRMTRTKRPKPKASSIAT